MKRYTCECGLETDDYIEWKKCNHEKKTIEKDAEEYAKFCVMCDRKDLPLIDFKDWIKQFKNN